MINYYICMDNPFINLKFVAMKRTFLFLLAIAFMGATFAQSVIYQDDFEAYTVGDYLCTQTTDWTTWSNAPGTAEDAFISDDYANSPTNSVKIDGTTDLVLPLGNKIAGKYELTFYYFIEVGYGGYYNLQHFEAPGTEWAIEVYFASDGTGEINTDGNITPFTYTPGEWLKITNVIDIDNDLGELFFDDVNVHTWVFSTQASGGAGTLQLGGLNVYAGAPTGDDPLFYMDDVTYTQMFEPLDFEDFEDYNVGDYIAVVNPEWWQTWSNNPGSAEDGLIVDDYAFSGTNSLRVDGTNDLIYKLGDKTAGAFDVNWKYYIPDGFAGYYNFQHFQAPGVEWAIEVFFNADGTGEFSADGSVINFTFDHDAWINIEHKIDLDNDVAEAYYDGVLIHTWTWNTQASGGAGTNQLGGVNFYAGAQGSDVPTYYVDDVFYQQTGGATDPMIEVDPMTFEQEEGTGTMGTAPMEVANVGGADLEYLIAVVYDLPTKKQAIVNVESSMIYAKGDAQLAAIETGKPGGYPPPTDDVILNYDGPNSGTAVGLTGPGEWRGAAKFPASMVNEYAGMELTTVRIYVNELKPADEIAIRVYGMNLDYLPGPMLADDPFTPLFLDWNEIDLTTPVPITGEDIWIGFWVNQTEAETYPIGVDDGPANPNGDWFSSGPGWSHLSGDYNWNLQGVLTGDPIEGWLSTDITEGTLVAGDMDNIEVMFDATNLVIGDYYADLVIVSNDPENNFLEIPVHLSVVDGTGIGEGDNSRIEMLVYPNPASSAVNVQANLTIDRLTIYNHIGQTVSEVTSDETSVRVNTEAFEAGVYFIRIETANGYTTQKLVIE